MKTTFRTINVIFLIVCFIPVFGQTNLIIPNKGIEGISIVIDSSKISDVIEIYGTDYTSYACRPQITTHKFDDMRVHFYGFFMDFLWILFPNVCVLPSHRTMEVFFRIVTRYLRHNI